MERPLGRREPLDWTHVDKYPLTSAALPTGNVPVVLGINWYSDFDHPRDSAGNAYRPGATPVGGSWWVGLNYKSLGYVRGGHCVCLRPKGVAHPTSWWDFYDQGSEGACVGFGCSHMMTMLNRKRYFARWLWDRAKEADEWPETVPGDDNGTSVRAALDVLRTRGHVLWNAKYNDLNTDGESSDASGRMKLTAAPEEGIFRNRWAVNVQDAMTALGYQDKNYVEMINNWGRYYPHFVRMPSETFNRVLNEDGEVAIVTDR